MWSETFYKRPDSKYYVLGFAGYMVSVETTLPL